MEEVRDGLLAWIQVGVNVSADYTDGTKTAVKTLEITGDCPIAQGIPR
jgi:hypothetical protein